MGRTIFLVLTTISLLTLTSEQNTTPSCTIHENMTNKSEHYLVKWKAWQFLSFVGLFGTISHLFLIYTFYKKRRFLATSVNTMVCMDTLYRLTYATVAVHWRTFNMVSDETVFQHWLGQENV